MLPTFATHAAARLRVPGPQVPAQHYAQPRSVSAISTFLSYQRIRSHEQLVALAAQPPGETHVLCHYGNSLGMQGAEVGVLKQVHQVGLGSFLQCLYSSRLETQVRLVVLGHFSHQPLEGQLPYEKLAALLVLANLSQSHSARSEAV